MVPFNVAASIKMRKWGVPSSPNTDGAPLQCGRIYKDAEMEYPGYACQRCARSFNVAASIKMRKSQARRRVAKAPLALQCGRIYKDAEMKYRRNQNATRIYLQCGRIYKDAEIYLDALAKNLGVTTFNVAASIKMRKLFFQQLTAEKFERLQCGRIYKDAEIDLGEETAANAEYLQCGRIYKDAEI